MLTIHTFCFNAFQENTFVLFNSEKEAIIVDPGCYLKHEQAQLANFISVNNLTPKLLLNTHCHLDHVFGNNFVSETYGLTALFHQKEQAVIDRLPEGGARWGVPTEAYKGKVQYIQQDELIQFGKDVFKVLETPGHSPGSVCFYNRKEEYVIAGDVLFEGSIGRTDLPGGDFDTLIRSIKSQLMVMSDDVLVYSGHGPLTTIGQERISNPYLQA